MKDPFEAALIRQETPPQSPAAATNDTDDRKHPVTADHLPAPGGDEEDEEDDNMADVEFAKFSTSNPINTFGDPDKLAKMQGVLSQFTNEQMNRYEHFRRSGFQRTNMRRLLASIIGTQKIATPVSIVVCSIAKMFVGDLVETSRVVMAERNESGPIRPRHMREAYRRLKLEGKIPRKSVPRLF